MKRTALAPSTKPMRRSPMGEGKRIRGRQEADQARVLEGSGDRLGLFTLHRIDWLHFANVEYSRGTLKSGHPDYLLIGEGWSAYLEIKARNPEDNRPGKLSPAQESFHKKLRAAGQEVLTALLPDDLWLLNKWLYGHTKRVVDIEGQKATLPPESRS